MRNKIFRNVEEFVENMPRSKRPNPGKETVKNLKKMVVLNLCN